MFPLFFIIHCLLKGGGIMLYPSDVRLVDYFAQMYARLQLNASGPMETDAATREMRRLVYNFKVTGFNVATAILVTSCALAILKGSIALAVLAAVSFAVRSPCMRAVLLTRVQTARKNFQQNILSECLLCNIFSKRDEVDIWRFLMDHPSNGSQMPTDWRIVKKQVLDCILWMNQAPIPSTNRIPVDMERY